MRSDRKRNPRFQAEVKQLLNLMIHSLYGKQGDLPEGADFERSDAADKLRFEALSGKRLVRPDADLKIRVSYDRQARTLTVSDNGIGMSREEVVNNIGTIAKSGTREFFQSLHGRPGEDARMIGQFGVGFYSSFIVADRVTLLTRRADARKANRCAGNRTGPANSPSKPRRRRPAAPRSSCTCARGDDCSRTGS